MAKVIDLAARRGHATDREKFLLDVYEAIARAIDGTVGDHSLDFLVEWHTDLEHYLWPDDEEETEA